MIQNRVRDLLVPNTLEMVFYGALTLVVIFVANLRVLTDYFLYDASGTVAVQDVTFGSYFDRMIDYVESLPFLPNSAVFVFWSLIGLVVYSVLQSIFSVYAEVKNDINITSHFLHPTNFIRWQFWAEVAVQFLAHISLYALTLLWAFLVGYVLMPLSASFARQFFKAPDVGGLIQFVTGAVLLYIGVLVFALILKLFFKRKQLVL
jgi:uncharacterized membrane protein (DUF485 family)